MTERRTSTRVPYTATQMFRLVADIEKYPDFIPWCSALRIVNHDRAGGKLLADMVVAYKVFRERFRSEVRLDDENKKIDVQYVSGPVRRLINKWRFEDNPDGGSTVHFFIDFEFKNALFQTAARAVFEKAFARMSDAFVLRAHDVYGGGEALTAEPI